MQSKLKQNESALSLNESRVSISFRLEGVKPDFIIRTPDPYPPWNTTTKRTIITILHKLHLLRIIFSLYFILI